MVHQDAKHLGATQIKTAVNVLAHGIHSGARVTSKQKSISSVVIIPAIDFWVGYNTSLLEAFADLIPPVSHNLKRIP